MLRVVHVFQEENLDAMTQHFIDCFQLRRSHFPEEFVGTSVCLCGGRLSVLSFEGDGVYGVYHQRVMA